MSTNPFVKTNQSSISSSAATTSANPFTGKPVYTTTSGTVTSSREDAEKDVKKTKKKRKSKSRSSSSSSNVSDLGGFAPVKEQSKQEPVTQSISKQEDSRVKSIRDTSSSSPFLKQNTSEVSIDSKPKEKTVSDLKSERSSLVSGLRSFYETKPVYAERGQGSQIGTEQVLKPEARQKGIGLPFSEKRLFQTKQSKDFESKSERLRELDKEIFAKTTGEKISKDIDITKLPEGQISTVQVMGTIDPTRKDKVSATDKLKELESVRKQKVEEASKIGFSSSVLGAGVSEGFEGVGLGKGDAAVNVLQLSKREKELSKEFQDLPVIYGETRKQTSERLNVNFDDLSSKKNLITQNVKGIQTSITPEQKAKRSLAIGAGVDVASLAVTGGIAAGATKLASKSPLLFKTVKAIDFIDDASDVYEIGSGVVNIATGNAGGAAGNIGNIVAGNVVAGRTSGRVAKGIDFTPVAETNFERKLFPVGVNIETLGYTPDTTPTTKGSFQEKRINKQLLVLPKSTRAALVQDGPEFKNVIVESRKIDNGPDEFISPSLASSTQAPDFAGTAFDRPSNVFETTTKTEIIRATPSRQKLTGIITEKGTFKPVRRNIPKEVGKRIGRNVLLSPLNLGGSSLALDVPSTSVAPKLRGDFSAREKLSTGFKIDTGIKGGLSFSLSPTLSTGKGTIKTSMLNNVTPTQKPDVVLEPDITPIDTSTDDTIDDDFIDTSTDYTNDNYITPTLTPNITPRITPKTPRLSFTPRRPVFRIPRTSMGLRGKATRGVKEFDVNNKILDISKGFRRNRLKGITGKNNLFDGRINKIKGLETNDISKKLKRLL